MGKINLYERQPLASSRVGTPGIDRSGEIVENIGQHVGQLTQQYVAVEKAKIEIADNIEADRHRVEFENKYYKALEDSKQENINNPYQVSNTASETGAQLSNDMAGDITNPRVKEKFLTKIQSSISSGQASARKWASDQTSTNAFINLNSAMEALATQGGIVKTPKDIEGLIESAQKLALNSAAVVGIDKAEKVYEVTKKAIYQNFAYANIDTAPETVKQYVDKGLFNGTLSEKEQLELKNSADSMIKKREREIDLQNKSYFVDRITDLYDKNLNDKLTLKEIDAEIAVFKKSGADKGDIMSLLTIKKSLLGEQESDAKHAAAEAKKKAKEAGKPGKISYEDQASTLVNITDKYLNVFNKPGAGGKVYSDVSLSELQSLQQEVIAAASSKKLDKQTANSMLKNIVRGKQELMKTNKTVTTNEGGIFGIGKETKEIPIGVYNEGLHSANDWANKHIPNEKARNNFKHDVITEYVNSYDSVKDKKGFTVNKYVNQIIGHYGPKYGKTVQTNKR